MGIKKISINIAKELASADEIRINVNCVKPEPLVNGSEKAGAAIATQTKKTKEGEFYQ